MFHEVSLLRSSTCEVFAGGPPLRIGDKGLEFELGTGSEGQFCRPFLHIFAKLVDGKGHLFLHKIFINIENEWKWNLLKIEN